MKHSLIVPRAVFAAFCWLALALSSTGVSADKTPEFCNAAKSWVTDPDPPKEIPGGGANFCQFYQFSWQWFLDLVSPTGGTDRKFQVDQHYPVLQADGTDSCDPDVEHSRFFLRDKKSPKTGAPMTIPERIDQAGAGRIFDQSGNVVFYNIRFNREMCDLAKIQQSDNYPAGTTEIKTAWRVIDPGEKSDYFWIKTPIEGLPGEHLLGMVGMHLVNATEKHPEFVWATFEHKNNAPDCNDPQPIPDGGWSFTSDDCARNLPDQGACKFNKQTETHKDHEVRGKPTEICRVNPYGTDMSNQKRRAQNKENIAAITQLNKQIVGPDGYLSQLPEDDAMAVWKNYFIVGALWESDTDKPSSDLNNQRGSLWLANTVMETTYQDITLKKDSFVSNCFGCHRYEVDQSNTLPGDHLSHIMDSIVAGQCSDPNDVKAGPIWDNNDARERCPEVCAENGGWNGQWTTTEEGVQSVCGCCQ